MVFIILIGTKNNQIGERRTVEITEYSLKHERFPSNKHLNTVRLLSKRYACDDNMETHRMFAVKSSVSARQKRNGV